MKTRETRTMACSRRRLHRCGTPVRCIRFGAGVQVMDPVCETISGATAHLCDLICSSCSSCPFLNRDSMFTLCYHGPIPWQHGPMCHHGPGPCQHAVCAHAAAFHVSTLDVSAETPPLRIRKTMSL